MALREDWDPAALRGFGSALSRAGVDELAAIREGRAPRPVVETLPTGWEDVDYAMGGGLRRKEVTVVLGDTGVAKSTWCEMVAHNLPKHRVAYFALELGRQRFMSRLLAKEMRLPIASVENILASRPNLPRLREALEQLCYERSLYVEDRDRDQAYFVDHLIACVDDTRPDLVVIDDLQQLDGWAEGYPAIGSGKDYKPRVDALSARSAIIDRIFTMADALNCAVLIPHQTKSEVIQKGRQPTMGDCADSMKLVRRADTVIALHRPFRGDIARDTVVEVLFRKNRNGPETTVHLYRNAKQLRFEDMLPDEEAALECCKPRRGRKK